MRLGSPQDRRYCRPSARCSTVVVCHTYAPDHCRRHSGRHSGQILIPRMLSEIGPKESLQNGIESEPGSGRCRLRTTMSRVAVGECNLLLLRGIDKDLPNNYITGSRHVSKAAPAYGIRSVALFHLKASIIW